MNVGVSRTIGAMFGLCAFAVAIISGLAVGNPAGRTLTIALVAMILCNLIGLIIGGIAERLVADHVARMTAPRPGEGASPTASPSIVTHNRARKH